MNKDIQLVMTSNQMTPGELDNEIERISSSPQKQGIVIVLTENLGVNIVNRQISSKMKPILETQPIFIIRCI